MLKILVIAASLLCSAAPAAAVTYFGAVIASGLNNPRGLAFSPGGDLYVAEMGFYQAGGPSTVVRGSTYYYGETGSITRVSGGVQQRIATGLPSLASTSEVSGGPADIAFGGDGTGYLLTGLGANPLARGTDLAPGGPGLGLLYSFRDDGSTSALADVAAVEGALNPLGGALDSNPYHLVAGPGGGLLITDAGSNTLLRFDGGEPSVVGEFPGRFIGGPPSSDSVPTGIAVGPDGSFYVAELTGAPFTPGAARIYRVTPEGGVSEAYTGFTMITDIAFGADGTLYVLELDSNGLARPGGTGVLSRIGTDGARELIFDQLVTPTGLAIGNDGAFYVTNFSAAAGQGQVLRIAAVPEPASWAMMILGFGLVGHVLRAGSRRRQEA